jgi:hypothetical protein
MALRLNEEDDRHQTRSADTRPVPEPSGPLSQLSRHGYTPKEGLASRVWARVWNMRATYIRLGLLDDGQPRNEKVTIARDALWHTALAIDVVNEYIERF